MSTVDQQYLMNEHAGTVELQPLNVAPSFSHDPTHDPWHHRLETTPVSCIKLEKKASIAAALAVVVLAGVIFAAANTANRHQQRAAPAAAQPQAKKATRGTFPAEPYLAPTTACAIDTQQVGPELLLAVPLNYHVLLNLSDPAFYQPGNATGRVAAGFAGAVNITLHVEQDASCVSLHARNISFTGITARLLGATWGQQQQQQQTAAQVCLCGTAPECLTDVCGRLFRARPGSESWILSLGPYTAPAGSTLVLQLKYRAIFGHREGLWRSAAYPSRARAGQQVVALSTALEPSTARMVLPCLDEPRYKATFVVEVEAPAALAVLSNAPTASTRWVLASASSSVSRVTFQPTPPMSPYLLSVVVGELKPVSGNTNSGQAVTIWTTLDTTAAAATALKLAVSALQYFQAFTNMSQSRGPDTKWDLLAIPGRMGAIENWGALMMDPERLLVPFGGAWDLFRSANVICHELAHQWFGNLVTAATWSDLLVNEGLATLAEYGCMADVLPQQIGLLGAAVLMRGMAGGPPGVNPGVHEGPFDKALSYDASLLAQPLLGSGDVSFGVPVYSKAAAVMAMVSNYAAAAAAEAAGTSEEQLGVLGALGLQYGPVQALVPSTPPSALQAVLRAHLQQHAYSTATALDTLASFIALTPPAMSSNTLAVITGWQSPGSPLVQLTHTSQGITLQQKRFCSWGLLSESFMQQLLSSSTTDPTRVPTPPSSNITSIPSSSAGPLLCPTSASGQDTAVPWTPMYITLLPDLATSADNSSSTDGNTSSNTQGGGCGQWVVLSKDEQMVTLPAGCQALRLGSNVSHSPGYIAEGDGGWGLYRTLYTADTRAALRKWVAGIPPATAAAGSGPNSAEGRRLSDSNNTAMPGTVSPATDSLGGVDVRLLLAGSKMLQDQAALALSAFGEVPGAEVWEVLQAAVNASLAAASTSLTPLQLQPSNGTESTDTVQPAGFGTVLFTLLAPLLPTMEIVLNRLAADRACWLQQQERLGSTLAPVAKAALSAFVGRIPPNSRYNSTSLHDSPDVFLGAMSLNRLLTATALTDAETANSLCEMFNEAVTGAGDTTAAAEVLAHIHPDLHAAVLDVAAAQPPGCQLDWSGDKLYSTLQQWYLTDRDARISTMSAFALAHFPARGLHSATPWPDTLALLLGFNSTTHVQSVQSVGRTHQRDPGTVLRQQGTPQVPASGISPARHAVELAVLVSRAVALSKKFPQPESAQTSRGGNGTTSSASPSSEVVSVLIKQWPQVVGSISSSAAWDVLREVAAVEVLTVQQWQGLAMWAAQQVPQGGDAGVQAAAKRRVQSVLGAAWSTVMWVQTNADVMCKD